MKAKFERKGKTIRNLETGENQGFKTVNEAKRESARIQRAAGGIGCGILRLAK